MIYNHSVTVSIIIPVYKAERYLDRCLHSIINQTYTDWECILVDDGSPDDSGTLCDRYAQTDFRFKVLHKENGGAFSARKLGIECSNGDYLFFLDSDDTISSNAIELLYTEVKKGYDIVKGLVQFKDVTTGERWDDIYLYNNITFHSRKDYVNACYIGNVSPYMCGGLYKRCLLEYTPYEAMEYAKIIIGEDWLQNCIIAHHVNRVKIIDTPVYQYFINRDSVMHTLITSDGYNLRIRDLIKKECSDCFLVTDVSCTSSICSAYIRNFFNPEIDFSLSNYNYVIKNLCNSDVKNKVKEVVAPKFLKFLNHQLLYYIYTHVYRFLFLCIKLKWKKRTVLL